MNEQPKNQIVIYETANQRVEVRLEGETVWLTQRQMAEVFDTTPENVLMHLKNIYHDGELEEAATTKDFLAVQLEGSRRVRRRLKHYNLDAIISVGYRVNSKRGVQFRIWATRVLRDHLLAGYTLNERRLAARGLAEAQQAVALLARTLTTHALVTDEGRAVLEVVQRYTRSWRLLLEYDEQRLADAPAHPVTPAAALSLAAARSAIDALRADLMRRGRASDLFGQERGARWPPSWAPSSRPSTATLFTQACRRAPHTCSISSSRAIPSAMATSASVRCSFSIICGATACSCAPMPPRASPTTPWWRWRCSSPKATARRKS